MTKRRITILGGGIGGLTTAYFLSRTPELRERFEVTIHQMGWKLGGKISSGRDEQGRNLEHGLHIWFGCYDNAFRMLQEIYANRQVPPESPFKTWQDVVSAQNFTPIGVRMADGWGFASIEWPTNDAIPGESRVFPTFHEICSEIINAFKILLDRLQKGNPPTTIPEPGGLFARLLRSIESGVKAESSAVIAGLRNTLKIRGLQGSEVAHLLHSATKTLATEPNIGGQEFLQDLADTADHLRDIGISTQAGTRNDEATTQIFEEAYHLGLTIFKGILVDLISKNQPLESLDDIEFRDWLISHGADQELVKNSSVVRALYDTAFFYKEGDTSVPSVGAGCALGALIRLAMTYKGAMAWELQGGMGDVFIAPLYQRLLEQGVSFEFFSKVVAIRPERDQNVINSVDVIKQAEMLPGYELIRRFDGVDCWLAEPDWAHLKDGERLREAGVDFESHWCNEPPVATRTLRRGTDFDDVVLAMPVGAWKKLNDDPGPCDELLARGGGFAEFTKALAIEPTIAVQLWTTADAKALGWIGQRPAVVAGPEPISVWADMSQVLRTESQMSPPAVGLHYLCGPFPTKLYAESSEKTETPKLAQAEANGIVLQFLGGDAGVYWPLAVDAQGFKWSLLADSNGRVGAQRLSAQYIRANINPTECCVRSDVGTTKFRLGPSKSGFDGLWLAGESTRSGFNLTCVEATVMSGMAAASAIGGLNLDIVGYDFPRMKPFQFLKRFP